MLPRLTRSASSAEEPGLPVEKWPTGTRNACTMVENRELLEYYTPNHSKRGYIQRMWDLCILQNQISMLTSKQLVVQCSNIHKKKLLSQLEIDEMTGRSGRRNHKNVLIFFVLA